MDIGTADLRIDYSMPSFPTGINNINCHLYLIYGLDLKMNEYAATIIQTNNNPGQIAQ